MAGFEVGRAEAGIELVAVTDANEGAFTIELPRGWQNQAQLVRPSGQVRSLVTSQRPDGGVFLFVGDPQLPTFTPPGMGMGFAGMDPMSQVHPYVPAAAFFEQQLQQRYGHVPGFRITGSEPCPLLEQRFRAEGQQRGINLGVTAATFTFEYGDSSVNGVVRARLHGATLDFGTLWQADVSGILASGGVAPAAFDSLLFRISGSYRTNPQWQQMQNQTHQQRMAQIQWNHQSAIQQMQSTHQQNMGWIQQSAQSHQARMDAIHAAGDAQLQCWYNQQASNDAAHQGFMHTLRGQHAAVPGMGGDADFSHQRFLNTVTEQETVVGPDGATYQVESGHERYFRHKHDNTYVGADSTTERDDLRTRFGVNPDDYEEVWIKR